MDKEYCIKINNCKIGKDFKPYLVAEMSANHNGKLDNALKILEVARNSGANAIKMQTYKAETITMKSDRPEFKIQGGLWNGKTLYDLYEWAHTPWEWHKNLFQKAKEIGITIFSSPFDESAVDLLEKLDSPAYKIASCELIHIPLIKYVASTKKPMIISTGMATDLEIEEAFNAAKDGGCNQIALLHCVSGYPALASEYNLGYISKLAKKYNAVIGLSDHTLDNTIAIASVVMGSSIIEKHFTLDRKGGGPDDSFSIEPEEFKILSDNIRNAWGALNSHDNQINESEQVSRLLRRSIYTSEDVNVGDKFTKENIKIIRPGTGLHPKFYEKLIGKKSPIRIEKGCPLPEAIMKNIE